MDKEAETVGYSRIFMLLLAYSIPPADYSLFLTKIIR